MNWGYAGMVYSCVHQAKFPHLYSRKNSDLSHPLNFGRHTWHCPYLSYAITISLTLRPHVHSSQTERHFLCSLSTNVQGIALRIHDGSNVGITAGAGQILTSIVDCPKSGKSGLLVILRGIFSIQEGKVKHAASSWDTHQHVAPQSAEEKIVQEFVQLEGKGIRKTSQHSATTWR